MLGRGLILAATLMACGSGDGDGPRLIVLNGVSGQCDGGFASDHHASVRVSIDGEEASFSPIGELWTTRISTGLHDIDFNYALVDCDGDVSTTVDVRGNTLVAVWGDPGAGRDSVRQYPELTLEAMDQLFIANLSQNASQQDFRVLVDGAELEASSLTEGEIVTVPLPYTQAATIEWPMLGLSEVAASPGSGGTIFSVRVCLIWDDEDGPTSTCTWTGTIG